MRWRHRRIRVARSFPKYFLRPLFFILTFAHHRGVQMGPATVLPHYTVSSYVVS
jgi:hypothetical protein